MAFLLIEDFDVLIKNNVLDDVTDATDELIDQVSLMAQQELESYLNQRYDCEEIFNATGDDRNKLLVMYAIDVSLYHLHARVNPRFLPEIRQTRYENAQNWLKAVAKGTITPNLPLIAVGENDTSSNMRFGSLPKFNSDY
jgi:phage gp36-like protein